MTDMFEHHQPGLESPATHVFAIIPDDGTDLAATTRAINVAAAGTVRLTTAAGDTADVFVAAGIPFPVRARRIHATGTTATGLVGLA